MYGKRGYTYIVRSLELNGKYLANSRNLCDAVRAFDDAQGRGIGCSIVCKNKCAPGSLKNQLQYVSREEIAAARETMAR